MVGCIDFIKIYVETINCYNSVNDIIQYATEHLILSHVGMNRGVNIFGKTGVNAIFREMKQFNDRNIVKQLKKHQITWEVRDKALGYLIFLKEKRTCKIKARGCADGCPQRLYKSKIETSSPTVATESIFTSIVNNTKEG